MRIGLKILGIFLALFGVFLLTVFPFALGNAIKTSDNGAVVMSGILVAIGMGFFFAGRHFFQLDPEVKDPAPPVSNLTRFLVNHRRDFKVLAQVGLVLSMVRLTAAFFGLDWPTRYATSFLLIGAFALYYCGGKAANPTVTRNRDWMKVPTWIRRVLEPAQKAGVVLWVGSLFLFAYAQWHHSNSEVSRFVSRIILDAMITFMYALTSLFFAYGELQPEAARLASDDKMEAPITPPSIS